ncbi:preprotein translocase subunit SecG, partial [Limnobacter sp.]|uniref:preprotein translocase subunit SecG n=1 Tax=Limnobacter sp. TaxID=2003368 RepID=UPI002737673B
MSIFNTFLVVMQIISAIAVIVLVLLQHGKGADMGAAFGSGSSGSLFGATGSANFLSRATGFCAIKLPTRHWAKGRWRQYFAILRNRLWSVSFFVVPGYCRLS